ncbi:LOW QUALITY PROTEIN: hypothetical protein Nmel_014558 [Mimus melanotis]
MLFPSCFKSLSLIQDIGMGMYESSWLQHTLPIVGIKRYDFFSMMLCSEKKNASLDSQLHEAPHFLFLPLSLQTDKCWDGPVRCSSFFSTNGKIHWLLHMGTRINLRGDGRVIPTSHSHGSTQHFSGAVWYLRRELKRTEEGKEECLFVEKNKSVHGARGAGTVLQDTLCSMSQLCFTGWKPHPALWEKLSELGQGLQNRIRTYKAPSKEKIVRICKHHPLRNILGEQQLWVIGSFAPFLPCSSLSVSNTAQVSAACALESHYWASNNTLAVLANSFSNVILITLVDNVDLILLVNQGLYLQTNPLLGCTACSQQLIVSSSVSASLDLWYDHPGKERRNMVVCDTQKIPAALSPAWCSLGLCPLPLSPSCPFPKHEVMRRD